MNNYFIFFFTVAFSLSSLGLIAQKDSLITKRNNGLKDEIIIHPGGGFSAYTLKKGTWQYAQIIDLKPGVLNWGVSDWLTITFPVNQWFSKTATLNVKTRILKQSKFIPTLAYETQYQYMFRPINSIGEINQIEVWRLGHNWFNKFIASWKIKNSWNVNVSVGETYSQVVNFNIPDSSITNDVIIGNNLFHYFSL